MSDETKTDATPQSGEGSSTPTSTPVPHRTPPGRLRRLGRRLLVVLFMIAAAFVIIMLMSADRSGIVISQAEQELQSGDPIGALERMEKLLREKALPGEGGEADSGASALPFDLHERAKKVVEAAAYEIMSDNYLDATSGDASATSAVYDTKDRAEKLHAGSGRLASLSIQLDRSAASPISLKQKPAVTDYGFDRDGNKTDQPGSAKPPSEDLTSRLIDSFDEAIRKHPTSLDLQLNYGQFLLELGEIDAAIGRFAEAAKLDGENADAQTGLGIARLMQGTKESLVAAEGHFLRAVELTPDDPAANLNYAAYLKRVGKVEEAKKYEEKAVE